VRHRTATQKQHRLALDFKANSATAEQVRAKRKKDGAVVWVEEELDQSFSLLSSSSFFRSQS
jgi:ABC-type uncharacterized transport system ATPase subunit